jgi:CRP-like cAMP-binding protein
MQIDPFTQLPASAIKILDTAVGDILFRQGQKTHGLFTVVTGQVTMQRSGASGDILTLHQAFAGDWLAEASVFSDEYHCDAVCVAGGQVRHIAKQAVLDHIGANPQFAIAFTRVLARQVQSYRFLSEITAIRSASGRVFAAVEAGYLNGTVIAFASRINLTHEACYRALRQLCHRGVLVQEGRGRYRLSDSPDQPKP